ncbi:MAG TPA: gliding motility-associated C-terminal domain-containing protein [Ferruginibacter sp.]|nr:hypothetical protein [Chitinophagaceae bacterium]HRI24891.1 gliding motility-associated C-terminal domain-containing protein [Ferruginibacter sp.]
MKSVLTLILLVFFPVVLLSQDTYLRWAKQASGGVSTTYDQAWGLAVDANGNVYSSGTFSGTVDFDPGPGVFNMTSGSNGNVFMLKLDVFGNFLWAKQLYSVKSMNNRSLAIDKQSNVYVTGSFSDTVDMDPGPGILPFIATGSIDMFVLKLSSQGSLVWAKQLNGTLQGSSMAAATDSQGNICIAGGFTGTVDFDPGAGSFFLTAVSNAGSDIFICKLDPSGNFMWAVAVGGNQQDFANGINIDQADNIHVTGSFSSIVDFDPGPGNNFIMTRGLSDIFILKLNASGNFVWAAGVGGSNTEWGYKTVVDAAGNVYTTGFFTGTADFDPGPGTFNVSSPGADAMFVLKLNAAGNLVWVRSAGGPISNNWGLGIALDRNGNVYTTGFFIGPADFDPGPGIFIMQSQVVDIFLLKLDNNGNFIWAKSAGANGNDQGMSVVVDPYNNIYVTGHFGRTVDFDLEASTYFLTADDSDPFFLKLAQCNSTTYQTLSVVTCGAYVLNGQLYAASGTYYQVLMNTSGCDSILTLNLTIDAKFSTVNAAICEGQSYYAGGANQTTTGIYKDTLVTSLGCDSIVTTVLTVHTNPTPDLGPDRKICTGSSVFITPGVFAGYLWQDNSTQPTFVLNQTGNYWVRVTDANNCSASDTLTILALDTIPKNFLPANQQLCYGNELKIAVPGYQDYRWSTGAVSSSITLRNFGIFYLTVKDFNDCTGTDSITVTRANCVPIAIPNAFTPNGDGLNDVFRPTINQEVKRFYFTVFNRYGEKIFETHEYGKGWDGKYKGKDQPAGSYVYLIRFTNIFGWSPENNGTVLLIR